MRSKRFVLDTNVIIAYFITGKEQRLIDYVADNDLNVVYCDELLEELERITGYNEIKKHKIKFRNIKRLLEEIAAKVELTYPIKDYLKTDPNDNFIIALALQTNSGYVASRDNDILSQKKRLESQFKKLKIITKEEFEKMFD